MGVTGRMAGGVGSLVMSVILAIAAAPAQAGTRELDTIADLFAMLRSCWSPPPLNKALPGMQMTLRFSFNRNGSLIAPPRVTYTTPGVSEEIRAAYFRAITDSLNACLPLHLSVGLGGALAGRPIAVRYIDSRYAGPSVRADRLIFTPRG